MKFSPPAGDWQCASRDNRRAGRPGRREVAEPVGIGNTHHNHLGEHVGQKVLAELPHNARYGNEIGIAIEQVHHRVALGEIGRVAGTSRHIHPKLTLLLQHLRRDAVYPAKDNGRTLDSLRLR